MVWLLDNLKQTATAKLEKENTYTIPEDLHYWITSWVQAKCIPLLPIYHSKTPTGNIHSVIQRKEENFTHHNCKNQTLSGNVDKAGEW